ncbi:MAG: tetratricopeptide repeat protein [Candidatus Bruticola sp.]
MASNRRKSTDNVQRKAVRQEDAEVREISPQEKRKNIFIQIGVWFLVIAFCMTSGIMCFAIGGPDEQEGQEVAAGAVDEIQSEIDRYTKEIGVDAGNVEALAYLGYYWMQKGDTLSTAESLKQEAKTKAALDKDMAAKGQTPASKADNAKPEMSREEAYANARTYLARALSIDSNYLLAKKSLADLEVREDHEDAAAKLYKEIITFCEQPLKLNPGDDETTIKTSRVVQKVSAEVQLARLYGSKEKYQEAIPLLDDAIKLDPGNIDAYHVKAMIYCSNGKEAEGVKAFYNAILIAKNMGELERAINLSMELAQVQNLSGDKAGAKKTYEEARDMIPQNMGGQAAQMRAAIQTIIDNLDGKKPAAKAEAPAAESAAPAAQAEAPVAESAAPAAQAEAPAAEN